VLKAIKKHKIFFLIIKMILLLGVGYLLCLQLRKVELQDWYSLRLKTPSFAVLSFLLVVVNWFFEWRKWELTLSKLVTSTTQKTNFKAFLAGITTGIVTPSMLGNFLGRMYYFKRNLRGRIILLTLLSNFSQFIASIFFGFLSFLFLRETPLGIDNFFVGIILSTFTILLLIFYFYFDKIKSRFFQKKRSYKSVLEIIGRHKTFRIRLLGLSLVRHFVFTLQFWLLFNAFEDAFNLDTFFWIWQIFLWTTLMPSLWFGKLMIRESIALLVLGAIGYGQVEILTSSILIWLINLAFPALIGVFICRQKTVDLE
jgi:MFS family permease